MTRIFACVTDYVNEYSICPLQGGKELFWKEYEVIDLVSYSAFDLLHPSLQAVD